MVEAEVSSPCCSCLILKKKINELEAELHALKFSNVVQSEDSVAGAVDTQTSTQSNAEEVFQLSKDDDITQRPSFQKCDMSNNDIARYSRQILLPEINAIGQNKIQKSSVLIVGAGGLGCPAALYLTASGVGRIGLVDYDVVDLSNLQRQILHREDTEKMSKVQSAVQELKKLNSSVQFDKYNTSLSSHNCMEIITKYDIVLDCSDNVATRYLLNDACIKGKKTLISGSALRWEGQLTVYNYDNGPCYRCLYPSPPPPETVTNCSDGGVMGAVTGVIGALQALEAIKIICGDSSSYAGSLLLFDGFSGSFRSIKLRGRVKECICGIDEPSLVELQDYEEFCGSKANDKEKNCNVLQQKCRVSVSEYLNIIYNCKPHLLLDVRPRIEFDICALSGSVNIPLNDILNRKNLPIIMGALTNNENVFVLCKRGNESQKAVLELLKYAEERGLVCQGNIKDVIGGLSAWSKVIDSQFPLY